MDRLWYRGPLALYDRAYRWTHGLDHSAAQVGPIIRLSRERLLSRAVLTDGTVVRRGDLIGIIHLDHVAVTSLHTDGLGPLAIGLAFRRQLVDSLHELALLTRPGGRLAHLPAFAAVTIFLGLRRLGFERIRGPAFPRIVGAYQRALFAWLHPVGRLRASAGEQHAAQRLMISRRELLARYGDDGRAVRRSAAASAMLNGFLRRASERP
jgi:YkoP domain